MNSSIQSPMTSASSKGIVIRYEDLRQQALSEFVESGPGLGLSLLVRQGMKSWIEAWSDCASNLVPKPPIKMAPARSLPSDFRSEVVTILVGMVLHNRWETRQ
jgi:hypothetical protein